SFKVDVRDISNGFWSEPEWGEMEHSAARWLHAVATAPFRDVLLLASDTDLLAAADPARAVFASPVFRTTGAVAWPGARPRNPESPLWDVLDLPPGHPARAAGPGMVFDSSIVAVDRARVGGAIVAAMHLLREGRFFTNHLQSVADALFWGFAVTQTDFHAVAAHPEIVGIAVDVHHPHGGASVAAAAAEARRSPHGRLRSVRYCGLAMVHAAPPPPPQRSRTVRGRPPPRQGGDGGDSGGDDDVFQPLMLHLRFHPDAYEDDIDFAQVGMRLRPATSAGAAPLALPRALLASAPPHTALVVERDVPFHPVCVALADVRAAARNDGDASSPAEPPLLLSAEFIA
ncbi:hypothetical protein HK405_001428, partial [Cladochytrium tenue]